MTSSETHPCALMLDGEQLILVRDLFAAHHVHVFLCDTNQSALLEDAWKPWARRMRPHTKHISGDLIICAPACIFPDPNNHPTIRASLATQLQSMCDIANTLEAKAVWLPLEAATADFAERITHYLAPLHARLAAQGVQLIVHIGKGSNTSAVTHMVADYDPAIHISSSDSTDDVAYHWMSAQATHVTHATPVFGPYPDAQTYRPAVRAWEACVRAHNDATRDTPSTLDNHDEAESSADES